MTVTGKKTTLGAQILATLDDAKLHPVDTARKKAQKAGKLKDFDLIKKFFAGVRSQVRSAVKKGEFPTPIRLLGPVSGILSSYSWRQDSHGIAKTSLFYPLWEEFLHWANEEELCFNWKYGHDGVGLESWWDLVLQQPAKK
jgi:hypothetical protein